MSSASAPDGVVEAARGGRPAAGGAGGTPARGGRRNTAAGVAAAGGAGALRAGAGALCGWALTRTPRAGSTRRAAVFLTTGRLLVFLPLADLAVGLLAGINRSSGSRAR